MHPIQVAVLLVLVSGALIYLWRQYQREIRAEQALCRTLVEKLSSVLLLKGLRLTWSADFSRQIAGTIATYEGPEFFLEVFWDVRDRAVFLSQRGPEEPRAALAPIASAGLPRFFNARAFAEAAADILAAAAQADGTAYLKPARFEVRDVFEITDGGRVVSGTILAGKFRTGARVWAEHASSMSFTISYVGFLDDIANHRAWVTFTSEDAPPLAELRNALSPGSILTDLAPAAHAI